MPRPGQNHPIIPSLSFPGCKICRTRKGPLPRKHPQRGEKPRPCHSRKGPGLSRTLGLPRPRELESGDAEGGKWYLELPVLRGRPVTLSDLGQGPFFPSNPAPLFSEECLVPRAVLAGRGRSHAPWHQFPLQSPSSSPESTSGSENAVAAVWGQSGLPRGLTWRRQRRMGR